MLWMKKILIPIAILPFFLALAHQGCGTERSESVDEDILAEEERPSAEIEMVESDLTDDVVPGDEEEPGEQQIEALDEDDTEHVGDTTESTEHREGESFARLVNPRLIASDEYMAPVISPTGEKVAMTKAGFVGLYILELATEQILEVSRDPWAGYLPIWSTEGDRIAHRAPGQGGDAVPAITIDTLGREAQPFPMISGDGWATQQDDQIVLIVGKTSTVIAGGRDRFFAPLVSPSGEVVVYNGLTSGIHLFRRSDRVTLDLGVGTHPSFNAGGAYLVFDRTEDDGAELTAGELYLIDLNDPNFRGAQLTFTDEVMETYPSMAAGKVVYSTGTGIYLADLEFD